MKWTERYNTLHNQSGSPRVIYSFTLSYAFREKHTLEPSMYLPARLLKTVFFIIRSLLNFVTENRLLSASLVR